MRRVVPSGPAWMVAKKEGSPDVHILPIGEEDKHSPDRACKCGPKVEPEGAVLIITHNAFDFREIVERAINVMNGVE